jgi:uncharacterized protein (DUF1778 family)
LAKATKKTERLDLRLSSKHKRVIEQAAALKGQSLSDFVLGVIIPSARKPIRDRENIELSDRDRDVFLAALGRTRTRALPGLRKAASRHKRVIG